MWDEMTNGIRKVVKEILGESKVLAQKVKSIAGEIRMYKRILNIKESVSKLYNLVTT